MTRPKPPQAFSSRRGGHDRAAVARLRSTFPVCARALREVPATACGDPGVVSDLTMLAEENAAETDESAPKFAAPEYWDEAIPYLNWLMDRDRKSTALKSLQGRIWKGGFERDELQGTLFDDVPQALERWSTAAQVAIYSSGSVAAQMLLFRHSSFGDLTPLISGYFDTRTGPKTSMTSYESIASAMGVRSTRNHVLFRRSARTRSSARGRLSHAAGDARRQCAGRRRHGHRRIKSFNVL